MDAEGLEATHLADTMQRGGPVKQQQLQPQLKPKLQLKLQPNVQHEPIPKSAPTPARRWETVPPQVQSKSQIPGHDPTAGSSIADRRLVLRREVSIPQPNKMDDEIMWAGNGVLFQQ